MTNHWVDIRNADIVLIMGGNAAEAHPCGFKWVIEAKKHNKAKLIVVDPRFTRSASVADYYAPLRTGTDIAFLGGVINYLLTNDKIQHPYVNAYTDLPFLVNEAFSFDNGLFSGYDAGAHKYDRSSWTFQIGKDGYVKTDPTLQDPRTVYQLLKKDYSRYTPEMVEKVCGTPKEQFLKVAEMIASTSTPDRTMTVMYALGWTQHSLGTQMIRAGAMVQLLLGNIGMSGGGMNALGGHSNIQGLTDLGLLTDLLPGYLTLPGEKETDYRAYIQKRAPKPLRKNQLSYWQNVEAAMALQSLDIVRRSATTTRSPSIRRTAKVAKLIDVTTCIGCKACQAACMEWNDVRDRVGTNKGAYDNPPDLTASSWTVMRFAEVKEGGSLQWLIRKDGCMHCQDPGCLKACPAPGAIIQYANGIVDFHEENCIGCGYCITGCPFDIPRLSNKDSKVYKCTLSSDRVAAGLEPACIKACPTGALQFGTKRQMREYAEERIVDLKSRGFSKAGLYDPPGVGGTHVMYVLHHADRPGLYCGLASDPGIGPLVSLWKGVTKPIASAILGVVALGAFFHYVVKGPNEVSKEAEDEVRKEDGK